MFKFPLSHPTIERWILFYNQFKLPWTLRSQINTLRYIFSFLVVTKLLLDISNIYIFWIKNKHIVFNNFLFNHFSTQWSAWRARPCANFENSLLTEFESNPREHGDLDPKNPWIIRPKKPWRGRKPWRHRPWILLKFFESPSSWVAQHLVKIF